MVVPPPSEAILRVLFFVRDSPFWKSILMLPFTALLAANALVFSKATETSTNPTSSPLPAREETIASIESELFVEKGIGASPTKAPSPLYKTFDNCIFGTNLDNSAGVIFKACAMFPSSVGLFSVPINNPGSESESAIACLNP